MFYYLIDLHYSQTNRQLPFEHPAFYYLIDLHYSQTCSVFESGAAWVLLPYRFTLFSNWAECFRLSAEVLLPYRFTLFSNRRDAQCGCEQFYYLIDLHYSQTKE